MRRRIDPHDLRDCTKDPHHYLSVYDGQLALQEPPLALRDEALWGALQEARARVTELENRLLESCTSEPLDAFEVKCGVRLWAMIDGTIDREEFDRLQDALVEHASGPTD